MHSSKDGCLTEGSRFGNKKGVSALFVETRACNRVRRQMRSHPARI
jgi:hypothetical protein